PPAISPLSLHDALPIYAGSSTRLRGELLSLSLRASNAGDVSQPDRSSPDALSDREIRSNRHRRRDRLSDCGVDVSQQGSHGKAVDRKSTRLNSSHQIIS